MSKKGTSNISGIAISVIVLVSLIPALLLFISNAGTSGNNYICINDSLPVLNGTKCWNQSLEGIVGAENFSALESDDAAYIGLSPVEITLTGLIVLILVISLVYSIIKNTIKKE